MGAVYRWCLNELLLFPGQLACHDTPGVQDMQAIEVLEK